MPSAAALTPNLQTALLLLSFRRMQNKPAGPMVPSVHTPLMCRLGRTSRALVAARSRPTQRVLAGRCLRLWRCWVLCLARPSPYWEAACAFWCGRWAGEQPWSVPWRDECYPRASRRHLRVLGARLRRLARMCPPPKRLPISRGTLQVGTVAAPVQAVVGHVLRGRRVHRRMAGALPTLSSACARLLPSERYGDRRPRWQECGWAEAASRAHSEAKFLFVYLHSPQHEVQPALPQPSPTPLPVSPACTPR